MKPSEIITPDIVRWVLGMEGDNFEQESLESVDILVDEEGIQIRADDAIQEFLMDNKGFILWNDSGVWVDTCRFIYLAIEKCAAEGWKLIMDVDEFITIWHRINGGYERRQDFYLKDYTSFLHAQLAAIAWVYSKMQEGK